MLLYTTCSDGGRLFEHEDVTCYLSQGLQLLPIHLKIATMPELAAQARRLLYVRAKDLRRQRGAVQSPAVTPKYSAKNRAGSTFIATSCGPCGCSVK